MPGDDGVEVTGVIIRDPTLAASRVLVLSVFELDEYVYGALREGASGFLLEDAPRRAPRRDPPHPPGGIVVRPTILAGLI